MSRNRDEKYIHKNKLETEPERKKKFGKKFVKTPKGRHYVEELESLIGAVIVLECDDWVFVPGELEGIPCEKLLLKSSKLVKCPASRGVECPVKISKKIWTAVDADFRERLGLKGKIDKYKSGIHGRTPIHVRGRVYEHKVFIDGIHGKFVKKNIGFQCFSMGKVEISRLQLLLRAFSLDVPLSSAFCILTSSEKIRKK